MSSMSRTLQIQFLSHLARHVGGRVVQVELDDPATVAQLLDKLVSLHGRRFTDNFLKEGKLSDEMVVLLVNGLNLKQYSEKYANPMDVQLKETDDIAFIVQFGGG